MTVLCAMSKEDLYGPFFFEGATVNGDMFLDMLENWLMDKLRGENSDELYPNKMGRPTTLELQELVVIYHPASDIDKYAFRIKSLNERFFHGIHCSRVCSSRTFMFKCK